MNEEKQYADRDIMDLDEKGGYYFRHVNAMTGESLHSKSDIAAELGHRDMLIDTYRDLCVELLKAAQGYVPHMPISTAKEGGANRHSGMLRASDNLKDAITKAESILGESQ